MIQNPNIYYSGNRTALNTFKLLIINKLFSKPINRLHPQTHTNFILFPAKLNQKPSINK